jgi:transcriptional regulator with XRE-family HTH domain
MPYRLNTPRLREVAALLGDDSDKAIRERTQISLGTLSRLVNGHVEPSIRHLDILSRTYDVPVAELYIDEDKPTESVAA